MKLFALLLALSGTAHADSLPQSIDFFADGRINLGLDLNFRENWNECQGNLNGNYVGLPCSTNRGMAPEFLDFLKANLFSCIDAGLAKVGGGKTTAVHVIHDGIIADENHESTSLHAVGRAIDILTLQVTIAGQAPRSFDFKDTSSNPDGVDRTFYEGFRACWGVVNDKRSCPQRDTGYPVGTIGWEDARHAGHHLHTSMPFCPNSNGHMITEYQF